MTTMRSMSASTSSPSGSSSGSTTAPSCTRPSSVLATASGSSLISFFMKLDQPPFSAAEASQAISNSSGSTGVPAKSVTVDRVRPDGDDLVLADLDRAAGVLDEGRDIRAEEVLAVAEPDDERGVAAGADDDAGLVLVHDQQREGALEARDDLRSASVRSPRLAVGAADQERGDLGVGLAGEGRSPASSSSCLSSAKFSMMPLWMRASLPSSPRCGCALRVGRAAVGRPAGVADAGVPVGERRSAEVVDEHLQLARALARARACRSSSSTATPAES